LPNRNIDQDAKDAMLPNKSFVHHERLPDKSLDARTPNESMVEPEMLTSQKEDRFQDVTDRRRHGRSNSSSDISERKMCSVKEERIRDTFINPTPAVQLNKENVVVRAKVTNGTKENTLDTQPDGRRQRPRSKSIDSRFDYMTEQIFLQEDLQTTQSASLTHIEESSIHDSHRQRFIKTIHKFEPDSRTLQKLEGDSRFFQEDSRVNGKRCASEINLSNNFKSPTHINLQTNKLRKSSSSGTINHYNQLIDNNNKSNHEPQLKDGQHYNHSTLPAKLQNSHKLQHENLQKNSSKRQVYLPVKEEVKNDLAEKRAQKMKEVRNKFFGFDDVQQNDEVDDTIEDGRLVDTKKRDKHLLKITGRGSGVYHASLASLNSDGSSDSQELQTEPGSKQQSPQIELDLRKEIKSKQYEKNQPPATSKLSENGYNLSYSNPTNHKSESCLNNAITAATSQSTKPGKESSTTHLNSHTPVQTKRSLDENLTGSFSTSFAVNKSYDAYKWKNCGKYSDNSLNEKQQFSPILSPGLVRNASISMTNLLVNPSTNNCRSLSLNCNHNHTSAVSPAGSMGSPSPPPPRPPPPINYDPTAADRFASLPRNWRNSKTFD